MEDGLHVLIGSIDSPVVEIQIVLVVLVYATLVEDAQHLVKPVVYLPVQTRYLYNDAVVVQAVYKLVGNALLQWLVVIVEGLVTHIDHGGLYIAHSMTQQIHSHHRNGVPIRASAHDVLRVLVVHAEILAEAQRLRGKPGLL